MPTSRENARATPTPQQQPYDAIVIGAGVSGLRCASDLRSLHGFKNVLVIEARDKIGGRVQQDWTFLPNNKPFECGAEFIHGDINPLVELCEQRGWARRLIFTWSHGDGGPAPAPAPDGGVGFYYLGAENKLLRFDDEDSDMKACNEALWGLGDVERSVADADPRTLRQYLQDAGVPPRMLGLADAGYGNTAGGSSDSVPVAVAMRNERAWGGDGTEVDPDFRMEDSFAVLIDHLAEGLDIITSCPVASIVVDTAAVAAAETSKAPAPAAVTITTRDGRVFTARTAVVTVPLPIIRDGDISFSPPLSPAKVSAAQSLSFANGVKVALKFSRPAWPPACHGVVAADSFIPEMWMNSTEGVGGLIEGAVCRFSPSALTAGVEENGSLSANGVCDEVASVAASSASAMTTSSSATVTAPVPIHPCSNSSSAGMLWSETLGRPPSPGDLVSSASLSSSSSSSSEGVVYTVTGYIMGTRADAILASHSQSSIIARTLSQLDAMFGLDATGAFVGGFVHDWSREPFIRGAYSTGTAREERDACARMAEPHASVVFFAGEATAGAVDGSLRHLPAHRAHYAPPVVLHGSMNTGTIAACDVARALGRPVSCACPGAPFAPTYAFAGLDEEESGAAAALLASHENKVALAAELLLVQPPSSLGTLAAAAGVEDEGCASTCGELRRRGLDGGSTRPLEVRSYVSNNFSEKRCDSPACVSLNV